MSLKVYGVKRGQTLTIRLVKMYRQYCQFEILIFRMPVYPSAETSCLFIHQRDVSKINHRDCISSAVLRGVVEVRATGRSESARCASPTRRGEASPLRFVGNRRSRPVASIPEITVCHVRQPWLSTSMYYLR